MTDVKFKKTRGYCSHCHRGKTTPVVVVKTSLAGSITFICICLRCIVKHAEMAR